MPIAFNPHQTNPSVEFPQAWERAAQVKLLVLDVDGVLTNGQVFFGQDGKELMKAFDIQDGLGIKLLNNAVLKRPSSLAEIPKWCSPAARS